MGGGDMEECKATKILDRKNPGNYILKCENGLIIFPNGNLSDNHKRFEVKYKKLKNYGVAISITPIHDLDHQILPQRITTNTKKFSDHYEIVEEIITPEEYKCKYCNYTERKEQKDVTTNNCIVIKTNENYLINDEYPTLYDLTNLEPNYIYQKVNEYYIPQTEEEKIQKIKEITDTYNKDIEIVKNEYSTYKDYYEKRTGKFVDYREETEMHSWDCKIYRYIDNELVEILTEEKSIINDYYAGRENEEDALIAFDIWSIVDDKKYREYEIIPKEELVKEAVREIKKMMWYEIINVLGLQMVIDHDKVKINDSIAEIDDGILLKGKYSVLGMQIVQDIF
ncbi:MAG: hypothetical protein OWS74_04305 [Firmicutes bacterium]|nr:hypothetical protein [Bacillota bacterium]